jgi:hypothetical protein
MEQTHGGLTQDRLPFGRIEPRPIDDPERLWVANREGMIRTQHDFVGAGDIAISLAR